MLALGTMIRLAEMEKTNDALEDIVKCSVFYLAMNVPQHKLLHDAYSYQRISKSNEASDVDRYKASILSKLLTEAYEMKERDLRGEDL